MPDYSIIKNIKDFSSLIEYLHDELDWDFQTEDIEDLTFDYEPEELGLDEATATKITSIKQLRPLVANQSWGIFYIDFEPKKLPVVALRRILGKLVIKRRATSKDSSRAAWQMNDLLFISSCGERATRTMTFAHFSDNTEYGDLPTLKTLSWNNLDTVSHLQHAHDTLKDKLHFPDNPNDAEGWRKLWSSAFTQKHGEVVRTSKQLAIRLAELADQIRHRVNDALKVESEKGSLRRLYNAFQEALIHDLSEDDFADMYAQTVSYGLLTAKISRPAGLVADNLADMIPVTNPFLKELLQTFLVVGGRGNLIDFDELGINDVVEMLRKADMEAVLRDFGDRNPMEDPAIHFYELFLKEYDPEKRMKRGVFYTPRPVVSFIVRSVDEILRKEFGLEDGLADITTWSEMAKRNADLKIPEGVKPDAPFVQILDPATGTGTFLVEVIEQIHKTMIEKWQREGKRETERRELWNEYVPKNLLPRLFGFELMMAAYSIAHMKIGLKLKETGYYFLSSERAQIFLTNTLEEPKDFSGYLETMSPALAHEAKAANYVKRNAPITTIIGNPPYSNLSSNLSDSARELVEKYKFINGEKVIERNALQLERNVNDDYVKFISWCENVLLQKTFSILSFITNNVFTHSPSLRGMRKHLLDNFTNLSIFNLHGASQRGEAEARSEGDINVFEIEQPVAISFFVRRGNTFENKPTVKYDELIGKREMKYEVLLSNSINTLKLRNVEIKQDMYYFVLLEGEFANEYEKYAPLGSAFPLYAEGIKTGRDWLVTDFEQQAIVKRMSELKESKESDDELCKRIGLSRKKAWNFARARRTLNEIEDFNTFIKEINYRAFDVRHIFYHPEWIASPSYPVMQNFIDTNKKFWKTGLTNLAFAAGRISRDKKSTLFWCSHKLTDKGLVSSLDNVSIFPLLLYPTERDKVFVQKTGTFIPILNLSSSFTKDVETKLNICLSEFSPSIPLEKSNAAKIFHFIYAVLNSPSYNKRYDDFLSFDFPRLPLTSDVALFRGLCALGADLVALHLLEDDYSAASWNESKQTSPLAKPIASIHGTDKEVAKGFPKYEDEKVYINKTSFFDGILEAVWNFHIGGYQVAHKWLKDRRERTLTDEDIKHYTRVVTSLNETIRLMKEIDALIEEHGGFPLVGSQDTVATPKEEPKETPALPFE